MIQTEREQCDRIISEAIRKVWCTFQRDGSILETSVGGYRHNFHFRVTVTTDENSSIVEAKMLRRQILAWFEKGDLTVNNIRSLHEVSDKMYVNICERFGVHAVSIEIAGEGENGIFVNYPLTRPLHSLSI